MKNKLIELLTLFLRNNDGIVYKTNYLSLLYVIEKLTNEIGDNSSQTFFNNLEKDTKRFLSSSLEIEKLYSMVRFQCNENPFVYPDLDMSERYAGLYFIYDTDENLLYIGKSEKNLIHRSLESFFNKQLYGAIKVKLLPVSIDNLSDLENDFIMIYKPILNQTETTELSNNYSYWLRAIFTLQHELKNKGYEYPVLMNI